MRAVEDIPNDATVCRQILKPKMGNDKDSLILDSYFQFSRSKENPNEYYGESLVWTKYAQPMPGKVHEFGVKLQEIQRIRKPACLYLGFVSAIVQSIREHKNRNGHSFKIYDAPADGDHHVEVGLNLVQGVELRKGEREELQVSLAQLFSKLVAQ